MTRHPHPLRTFLHTCTSVITCVTVIGCASSQDSNGSGNDPSVKELTKKNTINHFLDETQDGELIDKARWYVAAGLPSTAEEAFDALLTTFPDSPYTEFALLKTADGYYASGSYLSAAKAYADFIAQHPNDRSVPYAYLRQGRAYYKSYRGTGRDLSPLEQAQTCLSKFINNYPDSIYNTEARTLIDQVNNQIALHHEAIAAFYEKRGLLAAATKHREDIPQAPRLRTPSSAATLNPQLSE